MCYGPVGDVMSRAAPGSDMAPLHHLCIYTAPTVGSRLVTHVLKNVYFFKELFGLGPIHPDSLRSDQFQ